MSFQFDGKVLEGIRQAPVNSPTTDEPGTSIVRDVRPLPAVYELSAPDLVDAYADQYRVAALDAPGTTIVEYLVWAQNSAQLATVDDPSWWTTGGIGNIPLGTLDVDDLSGDTYTDGANRVVVVDDGNRSISSISWLVVARGDVDYDDDGWVDEDDPSLGRNGDIPYLVFEILSANQNPVSGVVTLTDAQLTLLDGGLSIERGDRIIQPRYTVAPPRFWWTRNDRYEQRFGWNGQTQRWEPWRGSNVKNLGYLLYENASFVMNPKIQNLPVGSILPGDASNPDSYSMIRLGTDPGVTSTPAAAGDGFLGIVVKPDDAVEEFDFSTSTNITAVMGQSNGMLVFNPAYIKLHAGKTVWYSYKGFTEDNDGVVGKMSDARTGTLFLAPLPGPTDYPILKYGSRSPLETFTYENDAALDLAGEPDEGQIFLSLSTGRLKLSLVDIDKADPDSTTFSKYYLGDDVIYEGVALNQRPQPTKSPVRLVDAEGNPSTDTDELFLPDSECLPSSFSVSDWNNQYRGLGVSGILNLPDGTGSVPMPGKLPVRPGGDNFDPPGNIDPNVGMIRAMEDGVSDTIIFGRSMAITTTTSYRVPDDAPSRIRGGQAYVCLQLEENPDAVPALYPGSRVSLGWQDRQTLNGGYVYFLQAAFVPATFTTEAKIYSRNRDIFRFDGNEIFYFNIDGIDYSWASSTLIALNPDQPYFTASEVAESLNLVAVGKVSAVSGRILLAGTTSVEIGFGGASKDLTGAAVLGFLPGWRVVEGVPCWLPDSGVSVGLSRSPINRNRSKSTADFAYQDRIRDGLLSDNIQPNPYFFFNNVPLQDIAGYDDNIFFQLVNIVVTGDTVQIIYKNLDHYKDVVYRFGQKKFDWVEENSYTKAIERSLDTLSLGNSGVVSESMIGAPGISGGFYVNDGESGLVLQEQDNDYILPFDGAPGNATLITRYGKRVVFGAQGTFVQSTNLFTDSTVNFNDPDKTVLPGYRLKITVGDAEGSYTIVNVSDHVLSVSPPFLWSSSRPVTWEVFEGFTEDVYDPMIVADMVYQDFNPLPEEPFKIRTLSYLGIVPASKTVQSSDRLKANVEGALSSDRSIGIRYGAVAPTMANTASLTWLTKTDLGVMENGSLILPDAASLRFTSGAFGIQIGTVLYSPGSSTYPLVGVSSFSPDPGSSVEYLTVSTDPDFSKGTLKFGTSVLNSYPESHVLVVDQFMDSDNLTALHAEISPWTGEVNLSTADMSSFVGTKTYFVEQMDTQKDVSIQPVSGTCAFLQPLPKRVLVEMEYYGADLEGRKKQYPVLTLDGNPTGQTTTRQITEFLPVFIRDEVAVRESDRVFTFNTVGNTVYEDIEPIIYIRAAQQNYNETNCVVDYLPDGRGKLTFVTYDVTKDVDVKVTYAVTESQGGERVYETSTKPVYRPPFYIKSDQNRFGLQGDRRDEFVAGQLLRFGKENFYVKGTKYYPLVTDSYGNTTGDITAVYIYPKTITEVGSRAPARDVLNLKTLMPITPIVDPTGDVIGPDGTTNPVPTTASLGLMHTLDLVEFPFEPMNRGQTNIVFRGNLISLAVPGHIIEFGGIPYTIVGSSLSEDGTRTTVSIASGIRRAFVVDDDPIVRITYRPVYPPNVVDFLGVGPFVSEEGYELVQYGLTDEDGNTLPGKTLVDTVDYTFDLSNGLVKLLEPLQEPLNAPQSLVMSFVKLRQLMPYMENGAIVRPTYSASYLNSIIPSADNGLIGGFLRGTYTFKSPDSFYFRIVPMTQFLVEVTKEVIDEISNKQVASGAPKPTGGSENWEFGRIGLKSERKHLLDKDRVARTFLDFYNSATNSFEQIKETISGDLIGDYDGKFRFWIGRGKEWPTPGYEDDITGILTPHNVWTDVFSANIDTTPQKYIYLQSYDNFVEPNNFTLLDSIVEGEVQDVDVLRQLMDDQKSISTNDVDDIVLSGYYTQFVRQEAAPYFSFVMKGTFQRMYENHRYSRIFPQWTKTFLRTGPGIDSDLAIGDAGWYSAGRYDLEGDYRRTTRTTIGQIANPVLGGIKEIRSVFLTDRLSRARIWQYYPDGIPEGAFGLIAPLVPSPSIEVPCLIATPGLIRDLPIDPMTGYPDITRMLSNSGDMPDLVSGDPEMAVPPFEVGDQLEWGKPDGRRLSAYCGSLSRKAGNTNNAKTGIYVNQILYGCVLTFQDADGDQITDPDNILVGFSATAGVPADQSLELGDTVLVVPTEGTLEINDPPTTDDMKAMAESLSYYRAGFDYGYSRDGQILDQTLPSDDDPAFFNFRDIFGQNPPEPLTCLEGQVEFYYTGQNPLDIPALQGLPQDDSGDYHVPFLRTKNTELDRFNDGSILADVMAEDDLGIGLYPDEYLSNDGAVITIPVDAGQTNIVPADQPAALLTATNVQPKTTTPGTYKPGSADLDEYDLIFNQVGDPGPFTVSGVSNLGAMGILSVGRIRMRDGNWNLGDNGEFPSSSGYGSIIEPPRFVTQTKPTSPIRYKIENAMVSEENTGLPNIGVKLFTYPVEKLIVLDMTDINIQLNNGLSGVGGLNDIWTASPNNSITIKFISHEDVAIVAGPGPLGNIPLGGALTLTLDIQGLTLNVINYAGGTIPTPLANVQFGVLGSDILAGYPIPPGDIDPVNDRYIILETAAAIPVPVLDIIWDPAFPPVPIPHPEWYLPYSNYDNGGNLYQKMDYGVDFTFYVDTYNNIGFLGESTTAWIDSDRLTFHEQLDFSKAKERGFVHPLPGAFPLETRLSIYEVTVGHDGALPTYSSTVNTYCNGNNAGQPVPFTFLPREGVVGTCVAGFGSISVNGFEGYNGATGNIPIIGNLATFTSAASNDRMLWTDATGVPSYVTICKGTGVMESRFDSGFPAPVPPALDEAWLYDNRVANVTVTDPVPAAPPNPEGVSQIESGDILVIKQDPNGEGTIKAGTYLVRHAIPQYDPVGAPTDYWWDSSPASVAGNETGWCPVHFPTIVSYDEGARELVVSDPAWIREIEAGNAVAGYPVNWKSGFPDPVTAPGDTFIYIIRDPGSLSTADPGVPTTDPAYEAAATTYKESIIRLKYTNIFIDGVTGECTFTLSAVATIVEAAYAGGRAAAVPGDIDYAVITTEAERTALLTEGYQVSGMKAWPVNVSGETYGLPENNVVGYDDPGTSANGFMQLHLDSRLTNSTPVLYGIGAFVNSPVGFGAGLLYPAIYDPAISNEFYDDRETPVYDLVVCSLINEVTDADWKSIDLPTTSLGSLGTWNYYAHCLLPSTHMTLGNPSVSDGHRARSGIYLEPSFPRQALNLVGDHPKVVDENDSLPDPTLLTDIEREIGSRSSDSYGPFGGAIAPTTPSEVEFEVRRIRRFHDIQDVNLKLTSLRYAYEIRRGRITDYTWDETTTNQRGIVEAIDFTMDFDPVPHVDSDPKTPDVWNDGETYTGTNLGPFIDAFFRPNEDVNVNAGDMFRILDDDGTVLESVRIERILSAGTLQLAAPGLLSSSLVGRRFEIYLRKAPVPLEQSAEELLELITDQEVLRTNAVWSSTSANEKGGYVPEMSPGDSWDDIANNLYDDLNVDGSTTNKTFGGVGVHKDDIVIIDHLGQIPRMGSNKPYIQESGMRPIGDTAVDSRRGYVGGSAVATDVYLEGYPDSRDDNRGYYRVTKVEDNAGLPHLEVTGVSTFAGDMNQDVIFDLADEFRAYAVYPTVHMSQLNPDGDERQMDLRPTKHRSDSTGTYNYAGNYHSVRPFSYRIIRPSKLFTDETVDLVLLVRERILSLIELIGRGFEGKSGDYWIFQAYNHIENLGTTWNPEAGLGLLFNAYLLSVLGRTDVSPFINNESCLSILDRRFWVMDTRLDSLAPTAAADLNPYGMKPVDPSAPGTDHPYTAYNDRIGGKVRPMLPERIDDTLDQRDRFRPARYVWLAYRTHTILGTLAAIDRFDVEWARRRAEQIGLLYKQESLEKVTS